MRMSHHPLRALKRAAAGLSRWSPVFAAGAETYPSDCADARGRARSGASHATAPQPCSYLFIDAPSVVDLERVIGAGAR